MWSFNQLWQTDFTYLKVIGWGGFSILSTILDDFSRYIIAWKLCTTMRADDVTGTLQLALAASGCASARVVHKPRLLSDNGSSYISADLSKWLELKGMEHVRGAPNHPQTQGKIERWHQTLKNRILLENYYLPGDLEGHIDRFVDRRRTRAADALHDQVSRLRLSQKRLVPLSSVRQLPNSGCGRRRAGAKNATELPCMTVGYGTRVARADH